MAEDQDMKRTWNWTKTLLVISLAANLVVAGIVIGSVFGHRHNGRPESFSGGGIRPYVASLPESQRRQVRDRLVRNRETLRAVRQEMRQSEGAVRAAMAATPFDADALEAAFAAQREIYDGIAANGHHALVEILSGMSGDERAQFIANLKTFKREPGPDRRAD